MAVKVLYNANRKTMKILQKTYRLLTPFKKGYIQYTTFKRWLKCVVCFYILNEDENFLVLGNWEQAIFVKPAKNVINGNFHKRIVLKGDGKYQIKHTTMGYRAICYPPDVSYEVIWKAPVIKDDYKYADTSKPYNRVPVVEYETEEDFGAEIKKHKEENNKDEIALLNDIYNNYFELI